MLKSLTLAQTLGQAAIGNARRVIGTLIYGLLNVLIAGTCLKTTLGVLGQMARWSLTDTGRSNEKSKLPSHRLKRFVQRQRCAVRYR